MGKALVAGVNTVNTPQRGDYDILPPETLLDAMLELWTTAYGNNRYWAYETSGGGQFSLKQRHVNHKDIIVNFRAWQDLALLTDFLYLLGRRVQAGQGWQGAVEGAIEALCGRTDKA